MVTSTLLPMFSKLAAENLKLLLDNGHAVGCTRSVPTNVRAVSKANPALTSSRSFWNRFAQAGLSVLISQACLCRHWFEMMDRIAKGLQDVKKSVRVADELP